jgi:two-component system response regulator ChvI
MSQLDARLGREYSLLGGLDRSPVMPALPQRHLGLGQNDTLSPTPSAELATIRQAELHRVVLVESNQYYRDVLTVELVRRGFVVHAFPDGASLLGSLASVVDADLAVLDWDVAKMPGIKLLAELRRHGVALPVVFLTGAVIPGNEHDTHECMAFDQGAVDFISKSRDRQILVRRLRRVVELARSKADLPSQQHLSCGRLVLSTEISRVFWKGVDVDLTLGEYKIVHLLVSKVGSFVTYRSLYDRLRFQGFIAGSGTDGFRANVRSAMKRIRNKFRACDPAFSEIENYNGFGYGWRKQD